MPSYILRKIDPELWQKFKIKAAGEGLKGSSLKDLIEGFIRAYVGQDVKENQ